VRLPHPSDRRKILVDVTDEGRRIVDHMLPVVHATDTEAFSVLTERERQVLIGLLAKVRRQLSEMAGSEFVPPKPRRKTKPA
jgi:DNA-binding MarR family transcriptional regulator